MGALTSRIACVDMSICLSHITAMEYYSRLRVADGFCLDRNVPSVAERMKKAGGLTLDANLPGSFRSDRHLAERLRYSELKGMSTPLHVLVTGREKRIWDKDAILRSHLWSGRILRNSFYLLAPDLYIVSPTMLLLQLVRDLSPLRLTQLLFEACGAYATSLLSSPAISQCAPVVSLHALSQFAKGATESRGGPALLRALDWVVAPSASPTEAVSAMLLCLPRTIGGYGLPLPHANHPIGVSFDGSSLYGGFRNGFSRKVLNGKVCNRRRGGGGGKVVYADLFWPEANLDLEYDGRLGHVGQDRVSKDYTRTNALESAGVKVLLISWAQLKSFDQFDQVARRIARGLGFRMRGRDYGERWLGRHFELRSTLLPPGKLEVAPWSGELLAKLTL